MRFIRSKCYHEPRLALKIQDVKYFAADEHGVREFNGDLVINLSGTPNLVSTEMMPSELAQHVFVPFKEVMVPWPDGGIPLVRSSFWQALHAYARDNGYKNICFHCEAGHGRTGTALSAMAISNLGWSVDKVIKQLRDKVCRHMVETSEQCQYLMELDNDFNGRELKEADLPDPSLMLMLEELHQEKLAEEEEAQRRREE